MITTKDIKQNIINIFIHYGMNSNGIIAKEMIESLTDSMSTLIIQEHENLKYSFDLIQNYIDHFEEIGKIINTFALKQKLTMPEIPVDLTNIRN